MSWLQQGHKCLSLAQAKRYLDPFVTLSMSSLELPHCLLWHHPLWLFFLSWFSSHSTDHTSSMFSTDNYPSALPLMVSLPQRLILNSCLFNLQIIMLVSSNGSTTSTVALSFFFSPIFFSILLCLECTSRRKSAQCWAHNECILSTNWRVNEWMYISIVQKCS